MFTLYFGAAALLILSYLGFYGLFYATRSLRHKYSGANTLRLGQMILVLAILLPVLALFLPRVEIEAPVITEFRAAGESLLAPVSSVIQSPIVAITKAEESNGSIVEIPWQTLLLLFIGFGTLVMLLQRVREVFYLRHLIRNGFEKSSLFGVRIVFSEMVAIPCSFFSGKGRVVLMPTTLLTERDHFRYALAHELEHIRQGDIYYVYFLELTRALFWWNPAAHLWRRLLTELAEMNVDAKIIARKRGAAKDYGHCLVSVAETALKENSAQPSFKNFYPSLASGMASGTEYAKTQLSRRIDMIIHRKKHSGSRPTKYFFGKASVLVLALLSLSLFGFAKQSIATGFTTHPKMQRITDRILKRFMEKQKAEAGFVLVADPNTGEVLAMSRVEREGNDLKNRDAAQFLHVPIEPFSQFKPMIAALALEEKVMDENTMLDASNGSLRIGGRKFHDWKAFGRISLGEAIAQSSTLATFRMAEALGEEKVFSGLEKFGFGEEGSLTRFDVSDGKVNLAYLANGIAAIRSTPLELVRAYGAIANGGNLVEAKNYARGGASPNIMRKVLSENTALRMRRILHRVVTEGTGRFAQSSKYSIAGKTGSGFIDRSQIKKGENTGANRAQFVGFAPMQKPELIALVVIDRPKGQVTGSRQAAPIARSLLNNLLPVRNVKPTQFATHF